MIICPVCGKETEAGYKFCMNCRSEIGGAGAPQAAQPAAQAATEPIEAAMQQAESAGRSTMAQAVAGGVSAAATAKSPKIMAAPEAQVGVVSEAQTGAMSEAQIGSVPGAQVGATPGAQVGAMPGGSRAMVAQDLDSYEPYIQQGTIPDYSNYPGMYSAPDPNAPKEKKKKKGPGSGRKVAAFFLGLILFFSGLATLSLYCVKQSLSVENLTSAITDVSTITTIKVGDMTGRAEDEGKTISTYILEQIPADQKEKFPNLTEDSLNKFMSDDAAKDVIAVPIEDLVGYMTGDKEEFSIDSAKIVSALEQNADTVEKYMGKKLDPEDLRSIREAIDEFNENDLVAKPGFKNKGIAAGMKAIKVLMSDGMLYVAAGITAFFALMIILVFGRYFDSALIRIGLTGTLVGGVVYFGIKFGRFAVDQTEAGKLGKGVLDMLDKAVFDQFSSSGHVVLIAGAGTIAAGVLLKIVRSMVKK